MTEADHNQYSDHVGDRRKPRAAFFGYSWSTNFHVDGYMEQHIENILSLNIDVDLYLGNHFAERRGVVGTAPVISPARLATHVESQRYDFAISFNNSMLMPKVVEALNCYPVSVIVDSEQHLFDYCDRGGFSAFELDIKIAPIYRSLEQDIATKCPHALERYHFLPPATDIDGWRRPPTGDAVVWRNISWIASLVGDHFLDQLIDFVARHPFFGGIMRECLNRISSVGYLHDYKQRREVLDFCASLGWEIDFLEIHLQNIVTNLERTAIVEELSHRGLALYGNDRWNMLIPKNRATAQSFMSGRTISSHRAQMDVYNASRLSINMPQAQAKTGMQYRILDVMASRSLLLTKHIDESDIDAVFEGKFPLPRFRTTAELGKFADHYLAREDERQTLVKACHELVGPSFSFQERVTDYLNLSNAAAAAPLSRGVPEGGGRGRLDKIEWQRFTNWTGRR